MDVEAVIVRVKQILVDDFELDEAAVHPDATLRDDLQMDSLDGMDLIVALEKEFGFRVDDKRLMTLRTVGQIYDYIREVASAHGSAPVPPAPSASEMRGV